LEQIQEEERDHTVGGARTENEKDLIKKEIGKKRNKIREIHR